MIRELNLAREYFIHPVWETHKYVPLSLRLWPMQLYQVSLTGMMPNVWYLRLKYLLWMHIYTWVYPLHCYGLNHSVRGQVADSYRVTARIVSVKMELMMPLWRLWHSVRFLRRRKEEPGGVGLQHYRKAKSVSFCKSVPENWGEGGGE